MPAIGPILALGSLGVVGLLFAAKGAKAAPGAGPAAPGITPIQPGNVPVSPEFQDVPLSLLQEMARALEMLTVDPNGNIKGPVTEDAIRNATALAAKLDAAGFPQAAKTIRDYAAAAAKHVPTPSKDKQIPLPIQCFTAAEQEQITRLATLERDPRIIRGVIDAMKKRATPPECKAQVDTAVSMLEAVALQMEARIAEEEALRRIEEELRKKNSQTPAPSPAPITPPFVPTPVAPVPAPVVPPPSPGSPPRVVIVNKGEGFYQIAKRLGVDPNRWPELRDRNVPIDADGRGRAKDTTAKGGIKPILQPGNKLFVPEQWPQMPGIPVPAPVTPAPSPSVTPSVSGPRVTVVQRGDGFYAIAKRLGVDPNRWPELRDRNVPVDADGRGRAKDTTAKGGIKPILQPGNKLFVPESWPQSSFAVVQGVPMIGIGLSDETITREKAPVEVYAQEMVEHLLRLQNKHPLQFEKIRGKMDKRKIARFEQAVGMKATARVTPTLLIKAAEFGQSRLPLVIDWPDDTRPEHVSSYKQVLFSLASRAKELNDMETVHELVQTMNREKGQGAGLSVNATP